MGARMIELAVANLRNAEREAICYFTSLVVGGDVTPSEIDRVVTVFLEDINCADLLATYRKARDCVDDPPRLPFACLSVASDLRSAALDLECLADRLEQ